MESHSACAIGPVDKNLVKSNKTIKHTHINKINTWKNDEELEHDIKQQAKALTRAESDATVPTTSRRASWSRASTKEEQQNNNNGISRHKFIFVCVL